MLTKIKLISIVSTIILISACSKNADDYIGLWKEENTQRAHYLEIKQDSGVYLLIEQPFIRNKSYVLEEKESKLFIESIPLMLSDDGKKLYIKSRNFQKVANPKKIYEHQAQCVNLNKEYKAALAIVKPKTLFPTKEEISAQEAMNRQFLEKFDSLEQQGACVEVPFNIQRLRKQATQ